MGMKQLCRPWGIQQKGQGLAAAAPPESTKDEDKDLCSFIAVPPSAENRVEDIEGA